MKGLERHYWQLRAERLSAAVVGCRACDAFKENPTPPVLDNFQHALRVGVLDMEERIRSWQSRSFRRSKKFKALRRRVGGSPVIGDHIALCSALQETLEDSRQMFRQFGDALAWTLFRHDLHLIFPLFGVRTHHLNPGVGITATTHIIIQAHRTGQFLVLDNDLTRCIGVGDITVFRANRERLTLPLSLELKARLHGDALTEGAEVSVNFTGTLYNNSSQVELHSDFVAALGLHSGVDGEQPVHPSSQLTEMASRAELLVQMVGTSRARLNASREHWKSLRNVLDRALQTGGAYDIPERGVALVAVRSMKGDYSPHLMTTLLTRLQTEGFPKGQGVMTLADFIRDDRLATVAPPIALWPLPLAQRAALLAGNVFLGCTFSPTVWDDALSAEGLTIQRGGDGWTVHGGQRVLQLDSVEVLKLRVGIAFGGTSPRDVARAMRGASYA